MRASASGVAGKDKISYVFIGRDQLQHSVINHPRPHKGTSGSDGPFNSESNPQTGLSGIYQPQMANSPEQFELLGKTVAEIMQLIGTCPKNIQDDIYRLLDMIRSTHHTSQARVNPLEFYISNGIILSEEKRINLRMEDYDYVINMIDATLRVRSKYRDHIKLTPKKLPSLKGDRKAILVGILIRPIGICNGDIYPSSDAKQKMDTTTFRQTITFFRSKLGRRFIVTNPAFGDGGSYYAMNPKMKYLVIMYAQDYVTAISRTAHNTSPS
jgi:hypothetical protein